MFLYIDMQAGSQGHWGQKTPALEPKLVLKSNFPGAQSDTDADGLNFRWMPQSVSSTLLFLFTRFQVEPINTFGRPWGKLG